MTNRLATELSPYLLQHANNPVDWYPWGEEAFKSARDQDRPIFLSIGYSTCHWCHVMEKESFENEEIAELLNRYFVPIKVDREERPDIDRVYMAFVQATTGSGGWPMSVWLTFDLKPFFGGTYFPPSSRYGRPGFAEILKETGRLWTDERAKLMESAESLMERLRDRQRAIGLGDGSAVSVASAETLAEGVSQFQEAFDDKHGGFGGAPKFPRPSELFFLLREHVRTGQHELLTMVMRTLGGMANGGMRDHVGGGFHRYSVDAGWCIPHFEKMLYDQAQLTLAYLEVGQLTGDEQWLRVAEETLSYVARDLTGVGGAFFSAEDADSQVPDKTDDAKGVKAEGAFYLWSYKEIESLLETDAAVVIKRYGLEVEGNASQDPMGEFHGKNQLRITRSLDEVSTSTGQTLEEVQAGLVRSQSSLFDERVRRDRPYLDDKVLTAWNGLMIAAFSRAAHVFEGGTIVGATDERQAVTALGRAQGAARFIKDTLWNVDEEILYRRYRDGKTSISGYSEDYAFLVWGLLELFQVDGDPGWLEWALRLQSRQDELFWDSEHGGWFSTTGSDPSVLLRMKEDYDGAEPSAGSVSAMNLLSFLHLTGDENIRQKLERALARFGPHLGRAARVVPLLTAALSAYYAGTSQVVVVGERMGSDTVALRRRLARHYLPFSVRINVSPGAHQSALKELLPFISSMRMVDGKATAYVCSNFACQEPVTDPETLDEQLTALRSITV